MFCISIAWSAAMGRRVLLAMVSCVLSAWLACDPQGSREPRPEPPSELASEPRGESPSTVDAGPGESPREPSSRLSYYRDIKSIVEQKCVSCHQKGGIGPFVLDSYASVFKLRAAIQAAVEQRRMPPWPAKAQCHDFKDALALEESQRQKLLSWLQQGAAEGDPKEYKATPRPKPGLPRVDLTLELPRYTPTKKPDDYRCFLLPLPFEKARYLRGFRILPGNPAIAHHMILFLAGPDKRKAYEALDAKEPGPGYTCFGGSGGPGTDVLAAWAPGQNRQLYPDDTGILLRPGSVFVVQMHYSTVFSTPTPDATRIELMLEDQVKRPATVSLVADFKWAFNPKSKKIPAGAKRFVHTISMDFGKIWQKHVQLYGLMPHQHLRGKSVRLTVVRKDGSRECAIDVPQWDFNWQFFYFRQKPLLLEPGDQLELECVWDNSADNQPIIDGKKVSPQDLHWGEGTNDEMCGVIFYATCTTPDGKIAACQP